MSARRFDHISSDVTTELLRAVGETFIGQYKIWTADCGLRTADCGLRTGLGIKHGLSVKRGLNIKWGLSLKIAVLTHKINIKNATFSVFSSAFELSKTKSFKLFKQV